MYEILSRDQALNRLHSGMCEAIAVLHNGRPTTKWYMRYGTRYYTKGAGHEVISKKLYAHGKYVETTL